MKALLLMIYFLFYLKIVASLRLMVQPEPSAAHLQKFGTRETASSQHEVDTDQASSNKTGISNKVDAITLPSASTTAPNTPASVSGPNATPSISNNARSAIDTSHALARKLPPKPEAICIIIITVPILVAIVILTILVFMIIIRIRRRKEATNRLSFHPEWMVQRRGPPLSGPSIAPHSQDLEEGSPDPSHAVSPMHGSSRDHERSSPDSVFYQTPPGPRGPRPRAALPRSPLVPTGIPSKATSSGLSSKTRTHRQRAISDQLEMLRLQMLELEQAGRNHGDPEMDEMRKKKNWLKEQLEGPWALGLTEVTAPDHDRYMSTL
jgi:hypothetical protein